MKTRERLRLLEARLEEQGDLGLDEACRLFGISTATARRDFQALAREHRAERRHGFLVRATPRPGEPMPPLAARSRHNLAAKQQIAAHAAGLLRDGDSLFVDGGSTTACLAAHLATRPLRVVTNSVLLAHDIEAARRGSVRCEVLLAGGTVFPESGMTVGPQARAFLAQFQVRWAFLSAAGLAASGPTNHNELVVEVESQMISQAEKTVLLADSGKLNRSEVCTICPWKKIELLVTDAAALKSPALKAIARAVRVEVAPAPHSDGAASMR